jgi:hypothetical protein
MSTTNETTTLNVGQWYGVTGNGFLVEAIDPKTGLCFAKWNGFYYKSIGTAFEPLYCPQIFFQISQFEELAKMYEWEGVMSYLEYSLLETITLFQSSDANPYYSLVGNTTTRTGWKPSNLGKKKKALILEALKNSEIDKVYNRSGKIFATYLNGTEVRIA